MKLNNKGFAITGILYGLLILFALLVGSYLTVLTARKNRLDGIVENIENEYNGNTTDTYTLTLKKGLGVEKIYYKINGASAYTSSSKNSIEIKVKDGETVYYYGEASERECTYIMEDCTEASNCSINIDASSISKEVKAITGRCLTIKKDPGVEEICYKIGDTGNFVCQKNVDSISKALKVGSKYYYYGIPASNYTMIKCTESNKCSSSMPNHEEAYTLAASTNTSSGPFNVKIYVWGTLEVDETTSNGTFETTIFANGDTDIYCNEPAIGTVDYSGNVTITNITKDTECSIG